MSKLSHLQFSGGIVEDSGFMEGADFFSTTFNAVYTRMMRDPAWGLKLTGKEARPI